MFIAGRYKVDRELSVSEDSRVYIAFDTATTPAKPVIVKVVDCLSVSYATVLFVSIDLERLETFFS